MFESEVYLDAHLAVFHPSYICQCVKLGSTKEVILGQYFFPPEDVQECEFITAKPRKTVAETQYVIQNLQQYMYMTLKYFNS